jgi:putative ABC transport system permease protein
MQPVGQILRRLAVLFRREKFHRDLDEEMQFHLEMQAEEHRQDGLDNIESLYAANRQLGNLTSLKEQSRDQWGWSALEQLLRDVRYSARVLRKNPGYAVTAVLTLGLGIGANCLLFSIVDPIILRPFPYPTPERLVIVWSEHKQQHAKEPALFMPSLPNFLDWRRENHVFEGMGASLPTGFDHDLNGYPEHIIGQRATEGFFATLGIQAQLGRTFTTDDEREGMDHVVVVSDRFWRTRLHADTNVVGTTLLLSRNAAAREKFTIIGVLPPSVEAAYPRRSEIWGAMALDGQEARNRRMGSFEVLARLKPGIDIRKAEAEMRSVAAGLAAAHPDTNAGSSVRLHSFHRELTRYGKDVMTVLIGAVAFVLLLACANVANLALARGTERNHEMTVRAAIGASRGRLFRQMLIESLVLSFTGSLTGMLLAFWTIDWARSLVPAGILRADQIAVDWRVLLFTFAVSMFTGVLFGMAPALRASRADLNPVLQTVRCGSHHQGSLRSVLVVAEVALGFLLAIGAGLMINSFIRLVHVDPGFDRHDLLAIESYLSRLYFSSDSERRFAIDALVESVKAIPAVRYAGVTDFRPLGSTMNTILRKSNAPDKPLGVNSETIAGDYFEAMGTQLIRGRLFTTADGPTSHPVAIVNEAAARRYWPGEDPIGKSFLTGAAKQEKLLEIVGVVGNVRRNGLDRPPDPAFYVPQSQAPSMRMDIVVRPVPGVPALTLLPAIRTRMANLHRSLTATSVTTMDDVVTERLSKPRFLATILGMFGFLALALTITGVYGVTAYNVRVRQREIGIRMALGADRRRVLNLVLGRGSRLVLIGLALGIFAAILATRALNSALYEVKPLDSATFVYVSLLIIAAAMAANYVPARRATTIDACAVLRSD